MTHQEDRKRDQLKTRIEDITSTINKLRAERRDAAAELKKLPKATTGPKKGYKPNRASTIANHDAADRAIIILRRHLKRYGVHGDNGFKEAAIAKAISKCCAPSMVKPETVRNIIQRETLKLAVDIRKKKKPLPSPD